MIFNGLLSLLVVSILFYFNIKKNFFDSFIKTFSFIWMVYLSLYLIYEDRFIKISDKFDLFFLVFFLTSCATYILFYYVFGLNRIKLFKVKPIFPCRFIYIFSSVLFFISTLLFLEMVYYNGINGIREAILSGDNSIYAGITFPFVVGAYYVANCENNEILKKYFSLMVICLALMSTTKIFLVIALIFLSGFYIKKISFIKSILLLICGFCLFSLIHIWMDKIAGKTDNSIGGLFDGLVFTLVGYLIGGLAVFQLQLDEKFIPFVSYNNIISFVTNKPDEQYILNTGTWIRTGDWLGNVQSGFSSWYQFGGSYSSFYLGATIGFIYALIFGLSKNHNSIKFLKIFSFYPIIFFIFNDTIFSAVKMWVAYVIVAIFIALTGFNRVKK